MATLASATFREPALNSQFQIHRSHSGRLFSPDIAPPAIQKPLIITPASVHVPFPNQVPVSTPAAESSDARGKGIATDLPALMEAPKTTNVEASQQEMEEILKITKGFCCAF